MKHTVTDVPTHTRYPWPALLELPAGKAIRVEFPLEPLYIAENARASAIMWCKDHDIKCSTKRVLENGVQALYVWQT